jgi:hypothetical protein
VFGSDKDAKRLRASLVYETAAPAFLSEGDRRAEAGTEAGKPGSAHGFPKLSPETLTC